MILRLKEYRRYREIILSFSFSFIGKSILFRTIDGVKDCYKSILCCINADQPLNDIFTQIYTYTNKKPRSVAPRTPRIVIIGPTGSGRKTLAMQISRKYDIPIGKIYKSKYLTLDKWRFSSKLTIIYFIERFDLFLIK